jgi:hypothetical protein
VTTFLKCAFWALLAALTVTAPALWRAHADPQDEHYVVCGALGADPTLGNVTRVLEILEAAGNTHTEAAGLLVDSVESSCSRYLPLLQLYIDTYGPPPKRTAPLTDQRAEAIA